MVLVLVLHGHLHPAVHVRRCAATPHRGGVYGGSLLHGPHVHGHAPIRLDDLLPDGREDDLAVRSDQVVVAGLNVRADHVHVHERLLDELFYTLDAEARLASGT